MNNLPSLPSFDLSELDPAIRRAALELIEQGTSANTTRSYATALRYWAAWFALRYRKTLQLPLSASVAVTFIVDHAQRTSDEGLRHELPEHIDNKLVAHGYKARPGGFSLASLEHRISVLSQLHRKQGLANPCEAPVVRELLARTRRAYAARDVYRNKKPALTREPLQLLLATCDDSLIGLRDRAMLLFALATGGRRRSEVVDATVERLHRIGPSRYVYVLGKSKTNQAASEDATAHKPLVGAAGKAMEAWLNESGIQEGRLFRRISRVGVIGKSLSGVSVRNIVIRRTQKAGLEIHFSAHSLRSGFMTQAGLDNISLAEAMSLSGHSSTNTALAYFRAGNSLHSPAAYLFDDSNAQDAGGE